MLRATFHRASGRSLFEIYTGSRFKHAYHLNSSIKAKTIEGKKNLSVCFLFIPVFIRTLKKILREISYWSTFLYQLMTSVCRNCQPYKWRHAKRNLPGWKELQDVESGICCMTDSQNAPCKCNCIGEHFCSSWAYAAECEDQMQILLSLSESSDWVGHFTAGWYKGNKGYKKMWKQKIRRKGWISVLNYSQWVFRYVLQCSVK